MQQVYIATDCLLMNLRLYGILVTVPIFIASFAQAERSDGSDWVVGYDRTGYPNTCVFSVASAIFNSTCVASMLHVSKFLSTNGRRSCFQKRNIISCSKLESRPGHGAVFIKRNGSPVQSPRSMELWSRKVLPTTI
jgi:hypothetical protein